MLRIKNSSSNDQSLLSTLNSPVANALNVFGSGASFTSDSSKLSHAQSGSPLVKKLHGMLDGPVRVAQHCELNAAHMDSLNASHDLALKLVVDLGADSAPDATKPNRA
jgi:hypothetical protein